MSEGVLVPQHLKNNLHDLHILPDVVPLYDFTYNDFAKDVLIQLLSEPLASLDEILNRQHILKGLIANLGVLKNYSYARIDLVEVFHFLGVSPVEKISTNGLKSLQLQLLFSEKKRHQLRGKCVQMVLLLHRLQVRYFNRIDISQFPEDYKDELRSIHDFLAGFQLSEWEGLIREQRFTVKHINTLMDVITEKAAKGEIMQFWKRCFLFEAYLSISLGIEQNGFTFPVFADGSLLFKELYHPLLKQPVKNDFVTTHNVVLLTGPNMSGKSTFLKAVALCVYLAHTGLAIPASHAAMPFFDSISVSIDLNDNIRSGYSHFMSEIMNVKRVVLKAVNNKRCFAVFDELFRGTNIEDATEISSATLKGLTRFTGSFFFISTHLHQLKELEEVKRGMISTYYTDCTIQNDLPLFNYRLKEGWSELRVGSMLFKKEGLQELLGDCQET